MAGSYKIAERNLLYTIEMLSYSMCCRRHRWVRLGLRLIARHQGKAGPEGGRCHRWQLLSDPIT